jgi:3-oxoacyl-[acyl-carrier-protein] synthase III
MVPLPRNDRITAHWEIELLRDEEGLEHISGDSRSDTPNHVSMTQAFITALGKFLPGNPIDNDSMEEFLGVIGGKPSRARQRVLRQNGIQTRHYAIDANQQTLFSNAAMAAHAVRNALERANLSLNEMEFMAAATSQGDFPLPGFASMVHGELKSSPCEIATVHGVCASGIMALKLAMLQVLHEEKHRAVACASEFASRLFKSTRFEAQEAVRKDGLSFDTEFLRWMLSDGAGAAVLANSPDTPGLCFRIEWIELLSFAGQFEPCMYVGPAKNGSATNGHNGNGLKSWLDYPSFDSAADAGAINLRQDIRMLDDVVRHGVEGLLRTAKKNNLNPGDVNWLAVHYSSNVFRDKSHEMAARLGFAVPLDRWFTNLSSTGNVGSASTFLLLEELLYSGRLKAGDNVLCVIPESGRFLFGYMLLKVVEGTGNRKNVAVSAKADRDAGTFHTKPPLLTKTGDPLAEELTRELALVWFELEDRLKSVPIVQKLHDGRFTLNDYQVLLYNLRQQVIDGSRWIARAASSITPEYFPIRSAFILHTSDEHRDFEMLEHNYELAGGSLDKIRSGQKNIGSEALSAYILQMAGHENPFELIGTMFIIEGIGQRIARQWGKKIQETLGLKNEAVSFFLYHSESDVVHFKRLDLAIASGILTEKLVKDIVRCAKVTARLYTLQLEEIGNF